MPRPRKSYADAVMSGSLAVNKGRFNDRKDAPPTTGDVGRPPAHLTKDEKRAWKEITQAIPAGVAGESDRIVIEMATKLLTQFRHDPLMQSSRLALLMQLCSRLGLDPQARTKLHTESPDKDDQPDDEWSQV